MRRHRFLKIIALLAFLGTVIPAVASANSHHSHRTSACRASVARGHKRRQHSLRCGRKHHSTRASVVTVARAVVTKKGKRTNPTTDTTPPTAPSNLAASATDQQVSLSWEPSTDPDSSVAGYWVYRNGAQVAVTTTTSYTDTALTDGTAYTYYVVAYDPSGNVSSASNIVSATPVAPTITNTTGSIYWGALLGPQFTGSPAPWSWPAVSDFQSIDSAGKPLSILHFGSGHWYSSTACAGYCIFPSSLFTTVRDAGVIPFYSWGSGADSGVSGFADAQIASGSQDAYITQWAQAAKVWGHPFFLRLDWEMNGTWFPWGVGANGNSASDYVAMWRHVHDIFTSAGATNVTWVWCPNIDTYNTLAPLPSLYPGDAYVDWTGLDGYNGDNPWTSFHNIFLSSYNNITGTIAPNKPMIIGETGSTETGGSKAQWITNMLADLPVSFPKVRGLLWYDRDDVGPGGYTDWPIESSSTSEAAFAGGISNPIYTGNTYADLTTAGAIPPPS